MKLTVLKYLLSANTNRDFAGYVKLIIWPKTQRSLCKNLWAHFLFRSLLSHSLPCKFQSFSSINSHLCFPLLRRLLFCKLHLCSMASNMPYSKSLDECEPHLMCFPFLKDQSSMLSSVVQCKKIYFSSFMVVYSSALCFISTMIRNRNCKLMLQKHLG